MLTGERSEKEALKKRDKYEDVKSSGFTLMTADTLLQQLCQHLAYIDFASMYLAPARICFNMVQLMSVVKKSQF